MSAAHPVLARLEAAGHAVRVDVRPYKGAGARSHRRGWHACEIRIDPPLPLAAFTPAEQTSRFVVVSPSSDGARAEAMSRLEQLAEMVVGVQVGIALVAEDEINQLRVRAVAARALAAKYRRPAAE